MRSKISKVAAEAKKRAVAAATRTRNNASTLLEVAGLAGIAVAVGNLAGSWWGVLVGSTIAVLYANALGARPPQPGDS